MGVVFRARDKSTGETVALKTFLGESAADIARARREMMAVSLLDHPNIVRHVAQGVTDEGSLYLAMEWLEGTTLADRIDRGGLTLRETVVVIRQIASALATAHDAGLLHRDVKPTNVILVNGDPAAVKLIDFGVARFGAVATSLTMTGATLGTPGYMAPEQVRGLRELTPATDVFSLGVVFYECATARFAFTGANQVALMTKVVLADPPPLTRVCSEAPPALVALVNRMLAKNAPLRPPDGAAVVAEIDELGPIPDGPRRQLRVEYAPKRIADKVTHCIVMASRGHPDTVGIPPSPEVTLALTELATPLLGDVNVLATGAVVGYFHGASAEARARASRWAEDVRRMLPDWHVVVSGAELDVAAAAESSAKTLATDVIASVFDKR